MIYELLEHIKDRIESSTDYKSVILPSLPGVYSLNTAYIIIPDNITMEFAITSEMFSTFTVDIYFVTADCNADDISTMSRAIMKGYKSIGDILNKALPRGERSYSDGDMDANCYNVNVSMKTWMTAGKLPVSAHLSTNWKAILKG